MTEKKFVKKKGKEFTRTLAPPECSQVPAQIEFLRAIQRNAPNVLNSLECDVSPQYKNMIEEAANAAKKQTDRGGTNVTIPPMTAEDFLPQTAAETNHFIYWYQSVRQSSPQVVEQLDTALERWADKYSINFEWVKLYALRTLRGWESFPELAERRIWLASIRSVRRHIPDFHLYYKELQLDAWEWEPLEQSRNDAENGILAKFKSSLEAHLDSIQEGYLKDGWTPTAKPNSEHFDWLVQKLVCRTPLQTIVKNAENKLTPNAFREGMNSAAKLVGINPQS